MQIINDEDARELECHELVIGSALRSSIAMAVSLAAIREKKLYKTVLGFNTFESYCQDRWEIAARRARDLINTADVLQSLKIGSMEPILPQNERQIRPLLSVPAESRARIWEIAVEMAGPSAISVPAHYVETAVQQYKEIAQEHESESPASDSTEDGMESPPSAALTAFMAEVTPCVAVVKLEESVPELTLKIVEPAPALPVSKSKFNQTNDNVEWALWTWNPVTGCDHGCSYCYAREIAERWYAQKFVPTFHPDRLAAPTNTKVPLNAQTDVRAKNVFVCSMADLFGKWVPQAWIDAVLTEVRAHPEWNFLFLTKFPQRLAEQDWPQNAWVGASVDKQQRVASAEKAFRKVNAGMKWLSVEPMLERLTFSSLEMFDWVVVGGQSSSNQPEYTHGKTIIPAQSVPEFYPPFEWIVDIYQQAKISNCAFYMKTNLLGQRIREYPSQFAAKETNL